MLKVKCIKFKDKDMNKVQILVNVVLVAAVAALFVLYFGKKESAPMEMDATPAEVMPVAYLNVDSLLANYSFAIEARDRKSVV